MRAVVWWCGRCCGVGCGVVEGVFSVVVGTRVPRGAHLPSFHISYYSPAITLVSASSSCFILAVSMCEVYCVGYTPRAWDPHSLQSMLNCPLYFGLLGSCASVG